MEGSVVFIDLKTEKSHYITNWDSCINIILLKFCFPPKFLSH